ncbi:hypothetical protein DD595_25010 [Enterobacter cloacae complex sp. 4DZ3-17B2]|nr:hypothetical protein DD580_29440 [Klebsiella pneumoniae]RYA44570.1 hypothetical protein DD606_25115 [Enterobacter cloacae complex sp. GF14B]RYA57083.1 hypothetical protein DD596_25030 [Enterobacter cloacae complex sp. 4DZ3-28B]RYA73425.1 hypothetical protein DD595_25010 [Enterobacter cloacae complex sp. 4DZ3-17B2]RYA85081.1 hypothetical protein DD594_25130 [Enterobacter cloacae complex sp. 4DZ1-17B1]RYA96491.1 hypothetical protein DD593_25135 [Enterobacter cloacae complex sp. 742-ADZ3-9B]
MPYRIYAASSLTDSLRSGVRLRRAEVAQSTGCTIYGQERKKGNGKRFQALPVFHRLRPPDKHHRI